jgi:hypothetical protein
MQGTTTSQLMLNHSSDPGPQISVPLSRWGGGSRYTVTSSGNSSSSSTTASLLTMVTMGLRVGAVEGPVALLPLSSCAKALSPCPGGKTYRQQQHLHVQRGVHRNGALRHGTSVVSAQVLQLDEVRHGVVRGDGWQSRRSSRSLRARPE